MLRLFRLLMPRDEQFIAQLCRHSEHVLRAAEAFRAMMAEDGRILEHCSEISRLEEAADEITRETILAIHRTFITPFDRSQILDLTTALDDTIDLMKEAARRIPLYGVAFTPEMREMADRAVWATKEIRNAMPLLASITRNVDRLTEASTKVGRFEAEADDLFDQGLRTLFRSQTSPGHKLTVEKVYDLIEDVVDRCEDVTDVLDDIVIEQV